MCAVACATLTSTTVWGQPPQDVGAEAAKPNVPGGTKWALLVGVDHYLDPRLGNLRFCGADAQALRDVLVRQGGFPADQVILLHDQEKEPIRQQLRLSVERSLKTLLAQAGPQDLVLVSFSGHGVQVGETAYLCPTEADLDKPEATMVSVAGLYATLSKECRAAQKIVFVDACRKPVESGQKGPSLEMAKGFADRLRQVPEGLLILSSCKSGQLSYEEQEFGHGIFVHYLLDGLNGKADARGPNLRGNADGRIDVDELFNYASLQTGKYVMHKFTEAQTPELYGVRRGPIDLLAALPDAREILDKALRAARSIVNTDDYDAKSHALELIAVTRARVGDFSAALDTARSINDASMKASALSGIAVVQASLSDASAAMKTALSISDESAKISALRGIAESQSMAGDFSAALDAVRAMSDHSAKTLALSVIANSQNNANDSHAAKATVDEALRASNSIANNALKVQALSRIAEAQVNISDNQGAFTTMTKAIEATRYLSDTSVKASTLREIAVAQAKMGDNQAARTTLRQAHEAARGISDESDKSYAQQSIAVVYASVGDFSAAKNTAYSITEHSSKVAALISVADAQAKLGDKEAARSIRMEALQASVSISDKSARASAERSIAVSTAKGGDIAGASTASRLIDDEWNKASSLREIANVQFENGDSLGARATLLEARQVSLTVNDGSNGQALEEIADAQIAVGDIDAALVTSSEIKGDQSSKASALRTVAMAQAKAGRIADARGTLIEAQEATDQVSDLHRRYDYALPEIAVAHARVGFPAEASETFYKAAMGGITTGGGCCITLPWHSLAFCNEMVSQDAVYEVVRLADSLPSSRIKVQLYIDAIEAMTSKSKE